MQSRIWLGVPWGFVYCGAQFIMRRKREKQRCIKYTSASSVIRGRSWPGKGTLENPQRRTCLQAMCTDCSHTAKWVAAAQAAVAGTWAELTSLTQSWTLLTLEKNHTSIELKHMDNVNCSHRVWLWEFDIVCALSLPWREEMRFPPSVIPNNPSLTREHLWMWMSRNDGARFLMDNQKIISVTGTWQYKSL